MKPKREVASLRTVPSIFGDDVEDIRQSGDIIDSPLSQLHPFKDHPYQVRDDNEMAELVNSIKQNGVLYPALVRPRPAGGYEIIAGHRRKRACELAGLLSMPVIVMNVDDDTATLMMVGTNCQRETILPSEKAHAYKMMLDAIKRQGARTSSQIGTKSRSDERIATHVGDSRNQIQRLIRLTSLRPVLLSMVDNKKIPLNAGVELSYLRDDEQKVVEEALSGNTTSISLAQASALKTQSREGSLSPDQINAILRHVTAEKKTLSFSNTDLQRFFPATYTKEQMHKVIITLLERWSQKEDSTG